MATRHKLALFRRCRITDKRHQIRANARVIHQRITLGRSPITSNCFTFGLGIKQKSQQAIFDCIGLLLKTASSDVIGNVTVEALEESS